MFLFNKVTAFVALPALMTLIKEYCFSDISFLLPLTIMVMLDTATGLVKHWKFRTVSSHSYGKLFTKILIYLAVLMVTTLLVNLKVNGESANIYGWVDDFVFASLLLREAISILENLSAIRPDLFPTQLLKRLRQFENDGRTLRPGFGSDASSGTSESKEVQG